MPRLRNAVALVASLWVSVATAAPEQYWICLGLDGVKTAQDQACTPGQKILRAPPGIAQSEQPPPSFADRALQGLSNHVVTPLQAVIGPHLEKASSKTLRFRLIPDVAVYGLILLAALITAAFAIRSALRRRALRAEMAPLHGKQSAERIEWQPPADGLPAALHRRGSVLDDRVETLPAPIRPMSWSMELLKTIEWRRFELLCLEIWQLKGFAVKLTAPGGNAVIADRADPQRAFAITQCRSWAQPVGLEAVRALWGSKDHFQASLAIFYSVAGFSSEAKSFAEGKPLELIDGAVLLDQISQLPAHEQIALLALATRGD